MLLSGRWAPGFARGDGVWASPSRARPASVRPVCCAFPGWAPLPAEAPPPAAPRFVYGVPEACRVPPNPQAKEAERPLQSYLQLQGNVGAAGWGGLHGLGEREVPLPSQPSQLSMAFWLQHS